MLSSTQKLLVLGAGSHAREIAQLVRDHNASSKHVHYELTGFLGNTKEEGILVGAYRVLGSLNTLSKLSRKIRCVLGIGRPQLRKQFVEYATGEGFQFETLVHPNALLGERVTIGKGVVIASGCRLSPDVIISDYALLNTNVLASSDVYVGAFASVKFGAILADGVQIGEGVDIGIGVSSEPRIRINNWSNVPGGIHICRDITT